MVGQNARSFFPLALTCFLAYLLNLYVDQAFLADNHNMDDKTWVANNSLAVVPWVSSHVSSATDLGSRGVHVEEPMDAEDEARGASMEVEESRQQAGGAVDGFHQWQQHCMIPQLPQNTSTPITWSWG